AQPPSLVPPDGPWARIIRSSFAWKRAAPSASCAPGASARGSNPTMRFESPPPSGTSPGGRSFFSSRTRISTPVPPGALVLSPVSPSPVSPQWNICSTVPSGSETVSGGASFARSWSNRCIGRLQPLHRGHFSPSLSHAAPANFDPRPLGSPLSTRGSCAVRPRPESFLSRRILLAKFMLHLKLSRELRVTVAHVQVVDRRLTLVAPEASVRADLEEQRAYLLVRVPHRVHEHGHPVFVLRIDDDALREEERHAIDGADVRGHHERRAA